MAFSTNHATVNSQTASSVVRKPWDTLSCQRSTHRLPTALTLPSPSSSATRTAAAFAPTWKPSTSKCNYPPTGFHEYVLLWTLFKLALPVHLGQPHHSASIYMPVLSGPVNWPQILVPSVGVCGLSKGDRSNQDKTPSVLETAGVVETMKQRWVCSFKCCGSGRTSVKRPWGQHVSCSALGTVWSLYWIHK